MKIYAFTAISIAMTLFLSSCSFSDKDSEKVLDNESKIYTTEIVSDFSSYDSPSEKQNSSSYENSYKQALSEKELAALEKEESAPVPDLYSSERSSESGEYIILFDYNYEYAIEDGEYIEKINDWLARASEDPDTIKVKHNDDDVEGGGGISVTNFILKTDGENYEKMFFINALPIDTAGSVDKYGYVHYEYNVTVDGYKYQVSETLINELLDIIGEAIGTDLYVDS